MTSDRMHGMIQTEARLFILLIIFLLRLSSKLNAAVKIHMDFLEGTFNEAIFFRFSHVARSLGIAP